MKEIKRVCVVGAGAIGGLCAGHLATVVETTVLTRRKEHADQLNEKGLQISGKSRLHSEVFASTDPIELGDPELVIIATKAAGVEQSTSTLSGHFPNAALLTIQNGLGCEEVVSKNGNWPVISAVTFMSGIRHSDVHVQYELDTETWMGPWAGADASYEDAEQVAKLFMAAGLRAKAFPDLLPAQWSKLVFNSVISSVAAVTELPHVREFIKLDTDSDLGNLIYDMMEEGRKVAAAYNVKFYEDPWEMNVQAIKKGETKGKKYAHIASMLKDVWDHSPTEIDWITGAFVREAAKVGIPVPLNHALYCLVKAREASWQYDYLKEAN